MTESSAKQFKLKLVSLEVNNFKSFSGNAAQQSESEEAPSHIVGPFTDFTGIIGPNGVGKSNIFDAIAFALNLHLAPGKARHARELFHIPKRIGSGEQADAEEDLKDFFVKLNFIKTNLRTNKSEKFCIQRGLKSKTDP